jgi:hypothetical protein
MLKFLSITSLALITLGCSSNPWKANFQPNPMLDERFAAAPGVEIRQVEFERLQRYENAERNQRIESATNPADYTPEQQIAAKNRLLEALQIKERGDQIQILGWSRFADSTPFPQLRSDLEKFARTTGADVVVASSSYAGQTTRVVDYPLTSYSNYYTSVAGGARTGGRSRLYSTGGYSTTWVPTTVTENQYYHQAVFLRRTPTAPAPIPASEPSR